MQDGSSFKDIYEKGKQLCEMGEALMSQAEANGYTPEGDTEGEVPGESEAAEIDDAEVAPPAKKDNASLAISLFRKK